MKTCLRISACLLAVLLVAGSAVAQPALQSPTETPVTQDVEALLSYAKGYNFGDSEKPLRDLEAMVWLQGNSPEGRAAIEQKLLSILVDATPDGKRFVGRLLTIVGSAATVPVVIKLVGDKETNDIAFRVLQSIDGAESREALLQLARDGAPETRLAAVQALGRRGEAEAVPGLAELASGQDATLAAAAITALGDIGGPAATAALDATVDGIAENLVPVLLDAGIAAANSLAKESPEEAVRIYNLLVSPDLPGHVRAAATVGLLQAQPDRALELATKAMVDPEPQVNNAALAFLRQVPGAEATTALASMLDQASPESQVVLLTALGDRGDKSAAPQVAAFAQSEDPAVRAAGIVALGKIGLFEHVRILLEIASTQEGATQDLARAALVALSDDGTNLKLREAAGSNSGAYQLEAIRALGQRNAVDEKSGLMTLVQNTGGEVQVEGLRALEIVGSPDDVPALLSLMDSADEAGRKAAEGAVAAIAARNPAADQRADAVLAGLASAQKPETQAALVRIAAKLPNAKTLEALRGAVKSEDAAVRKAAVEGLAEWPDSAPLEDLLLIAQGSIEEDKEAAFGGYIRLLAMPSNRSTQDQLERYRNAFSMAKNTREKRALLQGLADVASLESFELATAAGQDQALAAEINPVIIKVAQNVSGAFPAEARARMEQFVTTAQDPAQKAQAQAVIDAVNGYGDFITAWLYSGPYGEVGATANALFGMQQLPETDVAKAAWRVMPMGLNPEKPMFAAFDKLFTLNDKVVYLRTRIVSPTAQDAVLELGSNDGVKAWLNGTLVHELNVGRPVVAAQDKVPVKLKEGANDLLLAIYQQGGGWGAVARIADASGNALPGVKSELQEN